MACAFVTGLGLVMGAGVVMTSYMAKSESGYHIYYIRNERAHSEAFGQVSLLIL